MLMPKSNNVIYLLLCATAFIILSQNAFGFVQSLENHNLELNDDNYKNDKTSTYEKQDGRELQSLDWYAPPGGLPGSYEEYLENHPIQSAQFFQPDIVRNLVEANIALLIDETLYPLISLRLQQYVADLEFEGNSVFLQTITGGTPEEIKSWIIDQYNEGCTGFVFVGDITAAWAEVSGDVFPCDLYYMDLDGSWFDNDHDGDFETHTAGSGDVGPEVYVGRLYASTLAYDTEAHMINDYLAKAHAYRVGELTQPWNGLEYVEEDWYDMDVALDLIYGANVTRYDYGYFTTGQDYLDKLDEGHHFVQVCAHSYSAGHHFSTWPTESSSYAHLYVYSPVARPAKLLLGFDDGIKVWFNGDLLYTNDRYCDWNGCWNPDGFEVDVSLNQGWNRLLCKISQESWYYQLSARFTDMTYQTLEDLVYQMSDPDTHGPEATYVRSWLLNGFHQDVPDNFYSYLTTNYLGVAEGTINPEHGEVMGGKTWTTYASGYPFIDMGDYCGDPDYGVCYAFARINAESATSCELWLGYDDGARVWLNGDEILYDNCYGDFIADLSKIDISLSAGENRLLIKVSEWMGSHGFSARLCESDGSPVEGITYDPEPTPITYVGTWLVNGPYVNPNQASRLSLDYLEGEASLAPSEGDEAPFGTWDRGIGNGYPFDLKTFFDHGDWVYSEDIQTRDPPVLFYNLFSCGPGRFTDDDYLAGAYIFHTTYGLITIASSKSGSMLNFQDFTAPLGQNKCIGEAFHDWFDAQAPFEQWEKEWYYGMVICGDPTLLLNLEIYPETTVEVTKPLNAIYLFNVKIFPFFVPVAIGRVSFEINPFNEMFDIEQVNFYLDNELKYEDTEEPYSWLWNRFSFFKHQVTTITYDSSGRNVVTEIPMWKFF